MGRNAFSFSFQVAGRGNERRWAMVKIARVASVGGVGLVVGAPGAVSSVEALSRSDRPAAILIWPKIVVDSSVGADTVIQLSNTTTGTNAARKQAHCFYVNANSHCAANSSNAGAVCLSSTQCPSGGGLAA